MEVQEVNMDRKPILLRVNDPHNCQIISLVLNKCNLNIRNNCIKIKLKIVFLKLDKLTK